MSRQRLVNDVAEVMTKELLDLIKGLLPPEEYKDAFDEFVCVCRNGIERYELVLQRMQSRLKPGKN